MHEHTSQDASMNTRACEHACVQTTCTYKHTCGHVNSNSARMPVTPADSPRGWTKAGSPLLSSWALTTSEPHSQHPSQACPQAPSMKSKPASETPGRRWRRPAPRVWPRIPSSWGLLPARDVSCLNRSFQFLRLQHASTQHGNSPSRSWPQGADSCCAWQRPRLVHVTALMGRAPGAAAERVAT